MTLGIVLYLANIGCLSRKRLDRRCVAWVCSFVSYLLQPTFRYWSFRAKSHHPSSKFPPGSGSSLLVNSIKARGPTGANEISTGAKFGPLSTPFKPIKRVKLSWKISTMPFRVGSPPPTSSCLCIKSIKQRLRGHASPFPSLSPSQRLLTAYPLKPGHRLQRDTYIDE